MKEWFLNKPNKNSPSLAFRFLKELKVMEGMSGILEEFKKLNFEEARNLVTANLRESLQELLNLHYENLARKYLCL